MSEILVTGGSGLIGSSIVRHALAKGYKVRVLDNLSTGSRENLENLDVEFIAGDVTNPDQVREATRGVKYVFHDAALSASPQFVPDPTEGLRVNLLGFNNVLLKSSQSQVEKVVYAMTSSMYGNSPLPWKEDSLLVSSVPNVYALSLLARVYVSRQIEKSTALKTLGLVYFSVYGRNEAAKGEYANIISQFLWALRRNEAPVLYGDGSQTRDFVNEMDVAEANLLAAESNCSGGYLNVGTGRETSMSYVAKTLATLLHTDIKPIFKPNPIYGYCSHTRADTSKATKLIGFKSKIGVDEGLRDLVEYWESKPVPH